MHNKYNKFLIVSTIFISISVLSFYFMASVKNEKIIPTVYGSSLLSSKGLNSPLEMASGAASDFSFLSSLFSLKKIKIDVSLFSNKSFNSLKNNSVKLEQVNPGRINPFAPIGSDGVPSVDMPKITTSEATLTTTNSATLNGVINVNTGVGDVYFKYGLTNDNLNINSPAVKQQMVGTFIKNVSALSSRTQYYYTACAKINNIENCGNIVSFITN